ncbi:MAG: dUTP diphosphatase [Sphingomonadales bacterium]|jgi:dUTP pyrophosphatase
MSINVEIKRLPHGEGIELPHYASAHAAGMDIRAAVDAPVTLKSLERCVIPTGFSLAIPPGYEAQIRPRSGMALKKGLSIPNSPGTIDADYRGEVGVIIINLSSEDVVIERGERIAQMVFAPVAQAQLHEVELLDATARGAGGFGSTGVK